MRFPVLVNGKAIANYTSLFTTFTKGLLGERQVPGETAFTLEECIQETGGLEKALL